MLRMATTLRKCTLVSRGIVYRNTWLGTMALKTHSILLEITAHFINITVHFSNNIAHFLNITAHFLHNTAHFLNMMALKAHFALLAFIVRTSYTSLRPS